MLSWFNPRVVTVVLSVMLLISVTREAPPDIQMHRAAYTCAILFAIYVLVFLVPLRKAVRANLLIGMAASLLTGWTATALALIADAMPVSPEQLLHPPSNWARAAFVIAAGIAFYLFFNLATRGYEARVEMRITGRRPE